jgi:cell division transport system permease protein
MRALQYFFTEAAASLWRGRGAALVSIATIATGLFVLGLVLVVNENLQALTAQWSRSAELSVYLADDVATAQVQAIEAAIDASGLAAERHHVSKEQALARFKTDFPDLAGTAAALESNPFPASIELRLRPDVDVASAGIDGLVMTIRALPGAADVRYDRDWLSRLNAVVRGIRMAGVALVAILAAAAAMTVANVVRLAAAARRDEIEIMQLVGAPFAYVRGPFVAEGILQGGAGAILALAALATGFYLFRLKLGGAAAEALGGGGLTFLTPPLMAMILLGGMAVGCLGAYAVARRVR